MALIRPFVPARDFALSRAFYQAIGFRIEYEDDGLVIFEQDGAGFLLEKRTGTAADAMHQFFVRDLDGWWRRTEGLVERFGVRLPVPPALRSWGIRVGFLYDPSGVTWQVSEP